MSSNQEQRQDSVPEGSPQRRSRQSDTTLGTQADVAQHDESGSSDHAQPQRTQPAAQFAQASNDQPSTGSAVNGPGSNSLQRVSGTQAADGIHLNPHSSLLKPENYETVLHMPNEDNTRTKVTWEVHDGSSIKSRVLTYHEMLRISQNL
ncbi:hypothetical protein PG991_008077 [Apiospora marii]|uniref:Uncharacterized protein n=1 Tax=Apiospora marii TaxID=335849 RepID=A0ABR1RVF2_9PEZI